MLATKKGGKNEVSSRITDQTPSQARDSANHGFSDLEFGYGPDDCSVLPD